MVTIIGVRFKNTGKTYFFNPGKSVVEKGNYVVVETIRGIEIGEVAVANKEVSDCEIVAPLKDIIRIATPEDIKQHENNLIKNKEAFNTCNEKIAEHKIEMKLIDVEYTFDGSKILFYFTADGRVDFRDLVKDLASVFKKRIELRQVGVRDESKIIGGLGICGRVFCCKAYLGDFQPVSIKMAKEQGLSLNPTKISGTCGRLMCCLKYEQDAYEDLLERTPGVGSIVENENGKGVVKEINLLRELLKVEFEHENATEYLWLKASEVKVIKNARGFGNNEVENQEALKEILD